MDPLQRIVSIVDDDLSVREALTGLVSAFGFLAAPFASAEAFLRSSVRHKTSCLISDVNMPGLSGLALLDRLTALDQRVPPTILVSANPDQRAHAALARGAVGYLDKPIDPDQLLLLIRTSIAAARV